MNYLRFGLAWLAFWLAGTAVAGMVTVGALSLDAANVWQHADTEEEADFDSIILRDGSEAMPLEVFLPKQRVRPRTDEAKFIEQLEASWRRRYGDKVELDWIEAAGQRWRVCRRPGRGGDGLVYQIVTVHGGEAYQVIAAVPAQADKLPEPVRMLLASAVWLDAGNTSGPVGVAVAQPASPDLPIAANATVTTTEITPEAAPPPAEVSAAPAVPAKLGGQWHLLRKVLALPGSKAWPVLAEAEGALVGTEGLVKGLGLSAEADGIDGFLEGYLWKKGEVAGEYRHPFRRHWRVLWPAFPEAWRGGEDLPVSLDFLADAVGLEAGGDMVVRFDLTPVCAPRLAVVRWLDGLESRGPEGMAELARMACKRPDGGPAPVVVKVAAKDYPAMPEQKVSKRVALPLPMEWEQGIRVRSRQEVRRLVLTVRFQTSEGEGKAPGDAMFREAVAVFVFGPEV